MLSATRPWLVGNHDAHVALETMLARCFGRGREHSMRGVLFGESRLARMSLAHALSRPVTAGGVAEHVVLRSRTDMAAGGWGAVL